MLKTFTNMTIAIIWVGEGRSKWSYHEPFVPDLLGPDAWEKKDPTIFSLKGGEQWCSDFHLMGSESFTNHQLNKSQNMECCWFPLSWSPVPSEYHCCDPQQWIVIENATSPFLAPRYKASQRCCADKPHSSGLSEEWHLGRNRGKGYIENEMKMESSKLFFCFPV